MSLVGTLNFAARVKALHSSGRTLGPADALSTLTEYADSGDTFEALAALALAKGAKAEGVALRYTSHPSHLVRRAAVSSGLLTGEEAKTLLLSPDSSRSLRILLVRECPTLRVDSASFAAAVQLDANEGTKTAWKFLQQTRDEPTLRAGIESMGGKWGGLAVSEGLAERFPAAVIELQVASLDEVSHRDSGPVFAWEWGWLVKAARAWPERTLRLLLGCAARRRGAPPRSLVLKPERWAWARQNKLMLARATGPPAPSPRPA